MSGMFRRLFSGAKQPKNKFTLDYLRYLHKQLVDNQQVTKRNCGHVVETLRATAELLVWGDQHNPKFFDFFAEKGILALFVHFIKQPCDPRVKIQVIQTLSIFFQSTRSEMAVFYMLSNNYINEIVCHTPQECARNEDLLTYYISFLKTLSLRLNSSTVQLFYNHRAQDFPLFTEALRFFNHRDPMVRTSVQNLTLKIFTVEDPDVRAFVTGDLGLTYMANIMWSTARDIAADKRNSVEDLLYYFQDLMGLGVGPLTALLADQLFCLLVVPVLLGALIVPVEPSLPEEQPSSTSERKSRKPPPPPPSGLLSEAPAQRCAVNAKQAWYVMAQMVLIFGPESPVTQLLLKLVFQRKPWSFVSQLITSPPRFPVHANLVTQFWGDSEPKQGSTQQEVVIHGASKSRSLDEVIKRDVNAKARSRTFSTVKNVVVEVDQKQWDEQDNAVRAALGGGGVSVLCFVYTALPLVSDEDKAFLCKQLQDTNITSTAAAKVWAACVHRCGDFPASLVHKRFTDLALTFRPVFKSRTEGPALLDRLELTYPESEKFKASSPAPIRKLLNTPPAAPYSDVMVYFIMRALYYLMTEREDKRLRHALTDPRGFRYREELRVAKNTDVIPCHLAGQSCYLLLDPYLLLVVRRHAKQPGMAVVEIAHSLRHQEASISPRDARQLMLVVKATSKPHPAAVARKTKQDIAESKRKQQRMPRAPAALRFHFFSLVLMFVDASQCVAAHRYLLSNRIRTRKRRLRRILPCLAPRTEEGALLSDSSSDEEEDNKAEESDSDKISGESDSEAKDQNVDQPVDEDAGGDSSNTSALDDASSQTGGSGAEGTVQGAENSDQPAQDDGANTHQSDGNHDDATADDNGTTSADDNATAGDSDTTASSAKSSVEVSGGDEATAVDSDNDKCSGVTATTAGNDVTENDTKTSVDDTGEQSSAIGDESGGDGERATADNGETASLTDNGERTNADNGETTSVTNQDTTGNDTSTVEGDTLADVESSASCRNIDSSHADIPAGAAGNETKGGGQEGRVDRPSDDGSDDGGSAGVDENSQVDLPECRSDEVIGGGDAQPTNNNPNNPNGDEGGDDVHTINNDGDEGGGDGHTTNNDGDEGDVQLDSDDVTTAGDPTHTTADAAEPTAQGDADALHMCNCCLQHTLTEPMGSYEICPVCGWEDDPVQGRDPDDPVGANSTSLNEARALFQNRQPGGGEDDDDYDADDDVI